MTSQNYELWCWIQSVEIKRVKYNISINSLCFYKFCDLIYIKSLYFQSIVTKMNCFRYNMLSSLIRWWWRSFYPYTIVYKYTNYMIRVIWLMNSIGGFLWFLKMENTWAKHIKYRVKYILIPSSWFQKSSTWCLKF